MQHIPNNNNAIWKIYNRNSKKLSHICCSCKAAQNQSPAIPGEASIPSSLCSIPKAGVPAIFPLSKIGERLLSAAAALDFSNFGVNFVAFQVHAAQLISRRIHTCLCSIYYPHIYICMYATCRCITVRRVTMTVRL